MGDGEYIPPPNIWQGGWSIVYLKNAVCAIWLHCIVQIGKIQFVHTSFFIFNFTRILCNRRLCKMSKSAILNFWIITSRMYHIQVYCTNQEIFFFPKIVHTTILHWHDEVGFIDRNPLLQQSVFCFYVDSMLRKGWPFWYIAICIAKALFFLTCWQRTCKIVLIAVILQWSYLGLSQTVFNLYNFLLRSISQPHLEAIVNVGT